MNPVATFPLSGGASCSPTALTRAMSAALKTSGGGIRDAAPVTVTAWRTDRALRSRITGFRNLVRRLRKHFDAIIASVHLGLSNSRLEGINAKIRVIQRRGYGHPNPDSLASMIYLCLGGITITLPTQR